MFNTHSCNIKTYVLVSNAIGAFHSKIEVERRLEFPAVIVPGSQGPVNHLNGSPNKNQFIR